MEKPLEIAWVGPQLGVIGLGITRAGKKVLAKLMETQIWHQPVPAGRGLRKGTLASTSTSVWEKAALQRLSKAN